MAVLTLLRGPAGSGKSQVAQRMMAEGEADVLLDFTAIWAAVSAAQRDPITGKYPERMNGDALLPFVAYAKTALARSALLRGFRVVVTTSDSSDDEVDRWADVAAGERARFTTDTIDPGESTVRARLASDTGHLSPACTEAMTRWYKT